MKQIIEKNGLICIKETKKKPLQPEPSCCASSSQGPARVFLYFDKLTHFQMN